MRRRQDQDCINNEPERDPAVQEGLQLLKRSLENADQQAQDGCRYHGMPESRIAGHGKDGGDTTRKSWTPRTA